MKYSILIPTFNKCSEALRPCLESLIKFTDLSEDVEVIIVANGCTDETETFVTSLSLEYPSIKLLWFKEAIGYTKAGNEGIKASVGTYIVLLNNDTVFLQQKKNEWLDVLVRPFLDNKNKEVAVTGPLKNYCPYANRNLLVFFCVMISRKAIDKVGMLEEAFSPGYGEDTDWCCRAEDLGYEIVQVPGFGINNFPIYHKGGATFGKSEDTKAVIKANSELLRSKYNVLNIDISKAQECDGFMLNVELVWLAQQAKKHPIVIEVGSWHGRSTRSLGDNSCGVVYAVDHWKGSEGEGVAHASANNMKGDHAYYEFLKNNFDLIQQGKIIPIRLDTENASDFFKEKDIKADMIFIDAGHTYDEVIKDIENWMPLVKEGGILCGHDYSQDWDGVVKAVDEFFPDAKNDAGAIWWTSIKKEEEIEGNTEATIETAIIMPVYNSGRFICKTIDAIRRQSYKNWILVAIDDCSTDNSLEILKEYAEKDSRIKIIQSKENLRSPAISRNLAIEYISENHNGIDGENGVKYIAYCDSDDVWDKAHLSRNITFLNTNNADMVYSDARYKFENGKKAIPYGIPYYDKFEQKNIVNGNSVYISSVIHRKECFLVGKFDVYCVPMEDWDYWIRISEKYIIVHNPFVTFTYTVKDLTYYNSSESDSAFKFISEKYQKLNDVLNGGVEEKFNLLCQDKSDINEHLPILRSYAEKYSHITEMGMRWGLSTYAFMAGKPTKLISYDLNTDPCVVILNKYAKDNNVDFNFIQADVLKVEIEKTDVLFIDTLHTYAQLVQELKLHAGKVEHAIIFHDTTTFGYKDEFGDSKNDAKDKTGLRLAIEEFLEANTEWGIKEVFENNNGLTILEKHTDTGSNFRIIHFL